MKHYSLPAYVLVFTLLSTLLTFSVGFKFFIHFSHGLRDKTIKIVYKDPNGNCIGKSNPFAARLMFYFPIPEQNTEEEVKGYVFEIKDNKETLMGEFTAFDPSTAKEEYSSSLVGVSYTYSYNLEKEGWVELTVQESPRQYRTIEKKLESSV